MFVNLKGFVGRMHVSDIVVIVFLSLILFDIITTSIVVGLLHGRELNSDLLINYGLPIWIITFVLFSVMLVLTDLFIFRRKLNASYAIPACVIIPICIEFNTVVFNIFDLIKWWYLSVYLI